MASLGVHSVSKSFGSQAVLRSVSLEIPSGAFFFLLGPSGCGKSTLLRIIAGLERPDAGSVSIDGKDYTAVQPQDRGIGMVFQQYALWPHMTVEENLRFGLRARRVPKDETERRVADALRLVQMEAFRYRYPHELSGGQQQRVAVARALAGQPKVLLLDEPLSNLDARLRDEIRDELRELHAKLGITIIYVTHDQEDALTLASHLALMRDGQVVQEGSPLEVFQHPSSPFSASFLGDANVIRVQVSNGCDVSLPGRPLIRLPYSGPPRKDGEASMCVRPEFVRVHPAGAPIGSTLVIGGTVRSSTFRGAYQDLVVLIEGGESLRARAVAGSDHAPFKPGDAVSIGWDASNASLME